MKVVPVFEKEKPTGLHGVTTQVPRRSLNARPISRASSAVIVKASWPLK